MSKLKPKPKRRKKQGLFGRRKRDGKDKVNDRNEAGAATAVAGALFLGSTPLYSVIKKFVKK